MGSVLFSWIGTADLHAADAEDAKNQGPLARALIDRDFDHAVLLSNFEAARTKAYVAWAKKQTKTALHLRQVSLTTPTDHEAIYNVVTTELARALETLGKAPKLTFHLSPGTPAMAAIWIIVAKTRHPAELIESSKDHGVKAANVPFELSAELIPQAVRGADALLARREGNLRPIAAEFGDIVHRSDVMKRLLERAELCAGYGHPVLIEGESGTGKEMLASAIHKASPRGSKPFVVVNCGAVPPELVESEFFGHEKGAFTGAVQARAGHFENAHGSTLFLDEIGELPLAAQVKLLRVLQEGKVTRVGSSKQLAVDVRVIAATHRDLAAEVTAGRFREDLFYRLAVLVLTTPPLRDRPNDLTPLIEDAMAKLNQAEEKSHRPRKDLSPSAKNLLLRHSWPGNVRELHATLARVFVFTRGTKLDEPAIRDALGAGRVTQAASRTIGPIEPGFDLEAMLDELRADYIRQAFKQVGLKSKASALLGYANYQTLTNHMKRLGVTP
jgi:transcriptional regulator with PAS, ATPase and Fis domain